MNKFERLTITNYKKVNTITTVTSMINNKENHLKRWSKLLWRKRINISAYIVLGKSYLLVYF